jgi:Kef-type K+ transport system membrane component KefB
LTEHQLFLFLVEVAVLVVGARLGGELALRLGIPQVVGELVVGICLGPSLFGWLWSGGFRALFPADATQRGLLELMGWIGVIFLVVLSGWETRIGVVRRAGRIVAMSWFGGFALPFVLGFGLGLVIPANLIGPASGRFVFALFIATAMSISAIPVIARILIDLGLLRSEVGQVIMSTAVADDTVGWIVLAAVSGLVVEHALNVGTIATALVGTALFVVLAFTVGQWLVRRAFTWSRRLRIPYAQTTVVLVVVLVSAAITEVIHVHLVLGAFVAGILIARSPDRDRSAREGIQNVGMAFFIPYFFAYTGLRVDLGTLRGSVILVAVGAVLVACFGKFVGAGLGARIGGMPWRQSAAVGAGRNARGAMELVIAAIGLSIGVLTPAMYSIVVLVAVFTTLMAAPLLKFFTRQEETPSAMPEPHDAREVAV